VGKTRYHPGDNTIRSVKGRKLLRHQLSAENMAAKGFLLLVEGGWLSLGNQVSKLQKKMY
jgi:hypothetical protein